jgi:hypothetical protein
VKYVDVPLVVELANAYVVASVRGKAQALLEDPT